MRWIQSHPLLTVVLVAGVLRVVAAVGLQRYLDDVAHKQFLIAGDADGYWQLAETIRNGEPYAVYDPPRYLLRTPGFPAILAGAMTIGNGSPLIVRIVLALIGTTACGLTFLLGRQLVGEAVGLLAGLYVAFSPLQVGFSVLILSETAFAVPMIGSLMAAIVLAKTDFQTQFRRGLLFAGIAGSLIGLAVLIRPVWLPMGIVFASLCMFVGRFRVRSWLVAATIVGSMIFVLSPWTIRNWKLTGQPIMTALWSGPSLYDGLNPHATGASDMRFIEEDGLLDELSEAELNQHYWQAAWKYAAENPGRSIELAFLKVGRLWSPWLNAAEARSWLVQLPIVVAALMLFGFAVVGAWLNRRNLLLLGVTIGPALFVSAVHTLFVGSVRYRLPVEFPLAILAATGVQYVWCSRRHEDMEVAR